MADAGPRAERIAGSAAATRARPASPPRGEARDGDEALVAALREGRIEALEELYDRYSVLVFSIALRILRDRGLAEDVTQEVFLRLWRRPWLYRPERGRFVSWLTSITRNLAIDGQRRIARRRGAEEPGEDATAGIAEADRLADPAQAALLGEERAAVRAAVAQLPPPQRRVIELAWFGGLTQTEIAALTSTPLGTVKTRARLAMRRLRVALARLRPGDPPLPDRPARSEP